MLTGPESVPTPMMPIGSRPVLWHVMRYDAHVGHTEFALALGFGEMYRHGQCSWALWPADRKTRGRRLAPVEDVTPASRP